MSGLSCAYHLKNDYLLVEKSDEPGGLSRSIKQDGFVFDHTGHLLHLRNPYTLKLIPELLGDNLTLNDRRAWIYSHGTYTRYPFQANTHGLPWSVIAECLWGLFEAQYFGGARRSGDKLKLRHQTQRGAVPTPAVSPGAGTPDRRQKQTFEDWVLRTFGEGFGEHFFFPYNKKLWTVSPDELTTEWLGSFVPKPSMWEVLMGALTDQTKKFGYNASFYYPKEGGIQALAFAFAKNLQNIRLNTTVTAINLKSKEVTLNNSEVVGYDHLVNTLPLAKFLDMAQPLDGDIHAKRSLLRWTSVYNLNLGIEHADLTDKHWIYFPEKKYEFYRVGFPMNFAPKMTPPGCSSMYIEIAHEPHHPPDERWALEKSLDGLYECGLLNVKDRIVTQKVLSIPVAYVIYDTNWAGARTYLLDFLESHRVHSIGRFGGWKYSYMEEAILEGQSTAEKIIGK